VGGSPCFDAGEVARTVRILRTGDSHGARAPLDDSLPRAADLAIKRSSAFVGITEWAGQPAAAQPEEVLVHEVRLPPSAWAARVLHSRLDASPGRRIVDRSRIGAARGRSRVVRGRGAVVSQTQHSPSHCNQRPNQATPHPCVHA